MGVEGGAQGERGGRSCGGAAEEQAVDLHTQKVRSQNSRRNHRRSIHSLAAAVPLRSTQTDGTNKSRKPARHRSAKTSPNGRYVQVHGRVRFACASQTIQEPLREI